MMEHDSKFKRFQEAQSAGLGGDRGVGDYFSLLLEPADGGVYRGQGRGEEPDVGADRKSVV